jgi:ATP-binding cassette subfamily A (ABC1) protein 3
MFWLVVTCTCRVGADHDNEISKMYSQNNNGNGVFNRAFKVTVETSNEMPTNYLSGFPLITNQFIAMLLKKKISTLRNWFLLILQIALPVVLLIITVLDARGYVPKSTFPSLKISLDPYNEPITVMSGIANQYYEKYRNNIGNDHQLLEVSDIAAEMIRLVLTIHVLSKSN